MTRIVAQWAFAMLCVSAAQAQDALYGKRLYLDAGRLTGSNVSCVDCHLGYPPGLFGIARAANSPAIIEQAVNSVGAMTPLRGRLTAADYRDVAAYLGNPAVASPDLRVTTSGPASVPGDASRLDFGAVSPGTASTVSRMRLTNFGLVSMRLLSAPRIRGQDAANFVFASSGCGAAIDLQPQGSCEIEVAFQPTGTDGFRRAALSIDHDWVGGTAAIALIGTAASTNSPPSTMPPVGASGGGGALLLEFLLMAALLHWRSRNESRTHRCTRE